MKNLLLIGFILFSSFSVAAEVFQILDTDSYPENSKGALLAVIQDLKKNNKDLNVLHATADCSEEFCNIEVSLLETFNNTNPIRGCSNYCVHYGYNNNHGYIVKKAHIR